MRLTALAVLAGAASLAACAPVIQGGPPMDLPPGIMETAQANVIYMSSEWLNSSEDFSDTFTEEVREELSLCAYGTYPLDVRVHLLDLDAANGLEVMLRGHGESAMAGMVEFTDPARGDVVVGRYPVSVTADAGGRLTGLFADHEMVVSEAFGRAICDAAFARNPRRPGPWNATGG